MPGGWVVPWFLGSSPTTREEWSEGEARAPPWASIVLQCAMGNAHRTQNPKPQAVSTVFASASDNHGFVLRCERRA
eukprot:scaffold26659_cov35-Tisochrysis_lutea.AAC.1